MMHLYKEIDNLQVDTFREVVLDRFLDPEKYDWKHYANRFQKIFERSQDKKERDFEALKRMEKEALFKFNGSEHFYITGIDFPCWVMRGNNPRNRVMIIGSEPLRSEVSFGEVEYKQVVDRYKYISINTPYSYHQNYQNDKYSKIINYLVNDLDCLVYLTDYRKLWFAGWEHYSQYTNPKPHQDTLDIEIEWFQPNYIITFGKTALPFLKLPNEKISKYDLRKRRDFIDISRGRKPRVIPLVHPSNMAGGSRKEFFENNGIIIDNMKDKQEAYHELLERELRNKAQNP